MQNCKRLDSSRAMVGQSDWPDQPESDHFTRWSVLVNPVTRVSDIMGWRLDLINNALRNMFITVVTAMVLVTAHFLPLSACRHKTRTEGGELSEFCLMFPYTVSSL